MCKFLIKIIAVLTVYSCGTDLSESTSKTVCELKYKIQTKIDSRYIATFIYTLEKYTNLQNCLALLNFHEGSYVNISNNNVSMIVIDNQTIDIDRFLSSDFDTITDIQLGQSSLIVNISHFPEDFIFDYKADTYISISIQD
jgi:hypothetical protein